jgi:hypothetical protein
MRLRLGVGLHRIGKRGVVREFDAVAGNRLAVFADRLAPAQFGRRRAHHATGRGIQQQRRERPRVERERVQGIAPMQTVRVDAAYAQHIMAVRQIGKACLRRNAVFLQ